MSNLLVDITDLCITECVLVEDKYGGPTVLEGVLQRSDVKNANGRIYPRSLWERTLAEGSPVMKKVQERGMMGHLEHPKDGVTKLSEVSHLVTSLKLKENGDVVGRIEPTGPCGKDLQSLIDGKVRIGISSRGSGTVGAGGRVNEDYRLETFASR